MKPNWMKFVRLFSPEGADGGGGAGAEASGAAPASGAGDGVASAEAPAPAATFLTQGAAATEEAKPADAAAAPAVEGEVKTEASEAPTPFDLAAITLPEGFTLDEETGNSFTEVLSDEKLTPQERGQKLIDLHTTALKSAADQVNAANLKLFTETNEQWRAQIKELPEFKANPEAEAGKVMQALVSIGAGEDFFKAINLTGAGNHPAILQVLHKLTTPYFEGGAVVGGKASTAPRQLGANIYTSAAKP